MTDGEGPLDAQLGDAAPAAAAADGAEVVAVEEAVEVAAADAGDAKGGE